GPSGARCSPAVEMIESAVAERQRDLLERDHELAALAAALTAVHDGARGRLVLLCGEAGVGKTAVIQSFRASHGGAARLLWGACDPLFTPRPLGPLVDIARTTGNGLGELIRAGA